MTTLSLTDPVPETTTDATLIANNNAALKGVVNGNIDNANIAAAAAVLGSKLQFSAGLTPPGSPANGDLWLYTGAGSGVYWLFRYVSTETTYKWVFLGGSQIYAQSNLNVVANTQPQVGATGYYQTGATITLPRAGDYEIAYFAQMGGNGGAAGNWLAGIYTGATIVLAQGAAFSGGTVNPSIGVPAQSLPGVITVANTVVGLSVTPVTPATNKILNTFMAVRPIRVS